jgi:phenol 2-monooxygenase
MYGRACTLFPRTLEMLDQYEILDEFNQIGFVGRNSVNYDRTGKVDNTRGWQSLFECLDRTFLDFLLNIRLKYSEELIQAAYERIGGRILIGWEMTKLSTREVAKDGYAVSVEVKNVLSKAAETRILQGSVVTSLIHRRMLALTMIDN